MQLRTLHSFIHSLTHPLTLSSWQERWNLRLSLRLRLSQFPRNAQLLCSCCLKGAKQITMQVVQVATGANYSGSAEVKK